MRRILLTTLSIMIFAAILAVLLIPAGERKDGSFDENVMGEIDALGEITAIIDRLGFNDETEDLLYILEQLIAAWHEGRMFINQFDVPLLFSELDFEDPEIRERVLEMWERFALAGLFASREERLAYLNTGGRFGFEEALFRVFMELVSTAEAILDFSWGRESQTRVFTTFNFPSWSDGWGIGITDAAYLPIIRHLLVFAGIPLRSIDIRLDSLP